MYSIENYIGHQVRRISFLVKRVDDGKYHHLLSIVEYITLDMQDYDAFRSPKKKFFIDFLKHEDGDKDKVYFVVDFPILTKEFIDNPTSFYIDDEVVLPWDEVCKDSRWKYERPIIVPLHNEEKGKLAHFLPKRTSSAFVNVYGTKILLSVDDRIKAQVKRLSEKNLGKDFTLYPEFFGGVFAICYNPYYKSLDLTEDSYAPGIYIRIKYLEGVRKKLYFGFRIHLNDNSLLSVGPLSSPEGTFLTHFDLKHPYKKLDIDVFDENGGLIDYYQDVVFIHQVNFEMHIKSREIHVQDDTGKTVEVIEKYAGESFKIGNSKADKDSQMVAPELAYKQSEESLTCVFFDGDKNLVNENEEKAKDVVMKILNKAKSRCYICDMYFSEKTLYSFVLPICLENVEVRILSSKEEFKNKDIEILKTTCEKLLEKNIVNVHCRLLRGEKAALHDRFIVADDQVWLAGCSLDEIGKRATVISKVPSEYSRKIIERIDEWWSNDELSEFLI